MTGGLNGNLLDPRQSVFYEELLMPQVVSQDALITTLIEKRLLTKDEFLGIVKVADHERKKTNTNTIDNSMNRYLYHNVSS